MVWKKILGRTEEPVVEAEIDIEDYLNDLSIREGKIIEREDITYIKPMDLDAEGEGIGRIIKEVEKNNIVMLNVKEVLHNKVLLRKIVKELRDMCIDLDGDIGRVSETKILVVPKGMRMVHRGK